MSGASKSQRTIWQDQIVIKAPKSNYYHGTNNLLGAGCNNTCFSFSKGLKKGQSYATHNYCGRCRVFILIEQLRETKQGAKILCPCCKSYTRRNKARKPNG